MNMSLSGLCTSFSKLTLFSPAEVFCRPQICQKCVGGRGSAAYAPNPAGGAYDVPQTSYSAGEGDTLFPYPTPLGAFGASICGQQCKILATRMVAPPSINS